MFSEGKLSQAGQKNPNKTKQKKQSIGIKSFFPDTSYGLEHEKTASVIYLLKCS